MCDVDRLLRRVHQRRPQHRQLRHLRRADKVSISSSFYAHVVRTKVLCAAFLQLYFGFGKSTKALLYEKRAHKMLMKLTTGVNAINSKY